ncbi:MAG: Dabb family protein [Planctomycetes bacterium]|nr:Dabb family protein [Planctomycetota bacterium]
MAPAGRSSGARLAHDVFFTLTDNSPAACDRLVAACYERLAGIPGIVFFTAGTRVPDLQRDVNDKDYDVSLHVYFESRAAHDAYQQAAPHLQFIADNKANWKAVRVFDSDLAAR